MDWVQYLKLAEIYLDAAIAEYWQTVVISENKKDANGKPLEDKAAKKECQQLEKALDIIRGF